ncbi:hypothetical protein EPN83_03110 [Patescibacteria group bacterium]|nr:MAG: hypothetical protein EPN83_03110 [Patescibacteria group bacterium]
MTDPLEKIFSGARRVILREDERERLRSQLLAFVDRKEARYSLPPSAPHWLMFFTRHTFAAAAALLVLLGGAVSAAAEYSLPGDAFYGLKTGVTEQVRGWFARSAGAQASWQITLAERRLEEISKLAEDDKLNIELEMEAETRIASHEGRAREAIEERSSDEKEAKIALPQAELRQQGLELEELETEVESPEDEDGDLEELIGDLKDINEAILEVSPEVVAFEEAEDVRSDIRNLKEKLDELKKETDALERKARSKEAVRTRLSILETKKVLFRAQRALLSGGRDKAARLLAEAESDLQKIEDIIREER